MKVLELEGEKGEWGFKALKQMIKINFKLVCNAMWDFVYLHLSLKQCLTAVCVFVFVCVISM